MAGTTKCVGKRRRRWVRCGWIGFLLGVCMAALADTPPELADTPPELADGKLDVIIFPVLDEPFIAPNLSAGVLPWRGGSEHFQGIDIDLMVGFAAELGVEVEFIRLKEPGFGSLLPALVAGRGDLVASALTITRERDRIVDFSRPYFEVGTVVVTRTDAVVAAVSDLEGQTGVGVRGSRPISLLRGNGFEGPVLEADFQTGAYAEVIDGRADFAIMESASAIAAMRDRSDLKIAFSLPERETYGFAVSEGSTLQPLLDAYLERIEGDGTLRSILDRHLMGETSPDP